MLYKDIFDRVPDGDKLYLRQYPTYVRFDDVEIYQSFVIDKLNLRKELEKKYKGYLLGNSFRTFLEYAKRGVLNDKPIGHIRYYENNDFKNGKIIEDPWFTQNEEEIVKDVMAKYKDLLKRYSNIKDELTKAFWNKDKTFKPLGLDKYCLSIDFQDIYALKNGFDITEVCFLLNKDVKKIFIEKIGDDWGKNINYFQDACIFKGDKVLFASTTHEDWYSFKNDENFK